MRGPLLCAKVWVLTHDDRSPWRSSSEQISQLERASARPTRAPANLLGCGRITAEGQRKRISYVSQDNHHRSRAAEMECSLTHLLFNLCVNATMVACCHPTMGRGKRDRPCSEASGIREQNCKKMKVERDV